MVPRVVRSKRRQIVHMRCPTSGTLSRSRAAQARLTRPVRVRPACWSSHESHRPALELLRATVRGAPDVRGAVHPRSADSDQRWCVEMSQFHLRPDAARRGPTRLRPQDVASPTRGPTLELLRPHVRPRRFDTCFSAARAKPDAARRAAPTPPTANPPPTPSHVRHSSTGARRTRRVAASRAKSARHFRRPSPLRRRRTSDMARACLHSTPRPKAARVRSAPCA